jgi:hypothetical protein
VREAGAAIRAVRASPRLAETFHALCDFGGRLAGTDSELAARDFVSQRLDQIGPARRDHAFGLTGWQPAAASAVLTAAGRSHDLDVVTLPGSPPLSRARLPVTDGEPALRSDAAPGHAVLVSHGYPFRRGHVHRRVKYRRACESGAVAFLIANDVPGIGPVTGGVGGLTSAPDIPAAGLSHESGALVRAALRNGPADITLAVAAYQQSWTARNLVLDIPGRGDEWVVLCAHLDGHQLAESALDNASGVAVMLEIGRVLADVVPSLRCGLRIIAFTAEERGLQGSQRYVADLSADERRQIRCAIALDTVTGDSRLSALTGGDQGMEALAGRVAAASGTPVDIVRPLLPNSDHYSFQAAAIPAMRLLSGYGDPASPARYLLTSRDRRDAVGPVRLGAAAAVAATAVLAACAGPPGPA